MSVKAIGALAVLGAVGTAGYYGLSSYQTSQIEQGIADAMAEHAPELQLEYASIQSRLLSKRVEIRDVSIGLDSGESANIDRIIVHDLDTDNDVPQYMHVTAEGISLGESTVGPQSLVLNALGYDSDELVGTFELQYDFDESSKVFDANVTATVQEMWTGSAHFVYGNVDLSDEIPFENQNVTLISAELAYEDDSLIPRIYEFVSNMQQISTQEVEQMALGYVDRIQPFLPEGDFKRQITTAAATFIKNPQSLQISMQPSTPLKIQELAQMNPEDDLEQIADFFGMTITANAL